MSDWAKEKADAILNARSRDMNDWRSPNQVLAQALREEREACARIARRYHGSESAVVFAIRYRTDEQSAE